MIPVNLIDTRGAFTPQIPNTALAAKAKGIEEGKLKGVVVFLPIEAYRYYEACAKVTLNTMDMLLSDILMKNMRKERSV